MSKRRPSQFDAQPGGNATRLRGLDELTTLRLALAAKRSHASARASNTKPDAKRHEKPIKSGTTAGTGRANQAIEAELDRSFSAAVQDVTPLRSAPRIELERPKPAPLPRPQITEPEADTPPRRAKDHRALEGSALFRATLGDVQPLRPTNRADTHAPKPRPFARGESTDPFTSSQTALQRLLPPEGCELPPTELFRIATRGAQPIDTRNRVEHAPVLPPPEPRQSSEDEQAALRETMHTPLSFEDRLDMGEEAAFIRPGLPKRVLVDLRRGRWVLQGELDLHGLTRDAAREALAHFLAASLSRGRRCVRIIHGKGLGSPGKWSILKQLSRGWLAQREEILAFCQAGAHQGGSGALTVLLRAPNAGSSTR